MWCLQEGMMVRWMCGVSLKSKKHSVDLYSLLSVQSGVYVVRHGRLWWIRHLEHRSVDDWVSACRKVEVAGARREEKNRETWKKCVDDDMEVLGLALSLAHFFLCFSYHLSPM